MTAPDPDDTPDAPRDPALYAARPKTLGLTFWLVMAFGLVCVLAGFGIATYGPKLFPVQPKAAIRSTVPPPATALPRFVPKPGPPAVHEIDAATPEAARIGALADRLDKVEDGQSRLTRAAAGAIAAASLAEAAAGSAPFAAELDSVMAALPGSAQVRALRPYAVSGAQTVSGLAQSFPDAASRAALASRARTQGAGPLAQIAQAFAAIVTIRRVDRTTGGDPDAVLARAQAKLDDGDLAVALSELDTLPAAGREAVAPWRNRAMRRLEIDRRVSAIRAAALADLARASNADTTP
ncbi:MAG: COG4223 family protein [Caulobacteraceae bacterium]